jgi:hypothetical protein
MVKEVQPVRGCRAITAGGFVGLEPIEGQSAQAREILGSRANADSLLVISPYFRSHRFFLSLATR